MYILNRVLPNGLQIKILLFGVLVSVVFPVYTRKSVISESQFEGRDVNILSYLVRYPYYVKPCNLQPKLSSCRFRVESQRSLLYRSKNKERKSKYIQCMLQYIIDRTRERRLNTWYMRTSDYLIHFHCDKYILRIRYSSTGYIFFFEATFKKTYY